MTEQKTLLWIRISAFALSVLTLLSIPNIQLIQRIDSVRIPVQFIPIEEVLREPPKPIPPKLLPLTATLSSNAASSGAPVIAPTEVSSPSSPLEVFEPSQIQPTYGLSDPIFDTPTEQVQPMRLEPIASALPDVITERSDEGVYIPPASLPASVSQRGAVVRGAGSADLLEVSTPSYTGPSSQNVIPQSSLPSPGLTKGDINSTAKVPGTGGGEKYISGAGAVAEPGMGKGIAMEDVVGEGDISGLLRWLRGQKASFPQIVESYLETSPGDLKGIASYEGWDIFVQFSEDEHQLKLFLTKGGTGILLADSDFKSRSQLFGMGRVTRDAGITAIEASREKPSTERTEEFYRIFQTWMGVKGINMGARAGK